MHFLLAKHSLNEKKSTALLFHCSFFTPFQAAVNTVVVAISAIFFVVPDTFEIFRRIGITHYLFCQQNSLR